jgi:flagellin-like protein
MMALRKDEKGVSPVIGVILMVAITVILAAVIASFVFGLSGTMQRKYIIGFTVTGVSDKEVYVRYEGGPDHAYVSSCNAMVNGQSIENSGIETTVGYVSKIPHGINKPGSTFDFAIVCTFKDGSQQVVYSAKLVVPPS